MKVPYVITADFESLLIPNDESVGQGKKIQKHEACSYSYVKFRYDGMSEERKIYVGKDAAKHFVLAIIQEMFKIRDEYKKPVPMKELTSEENERHNNATKCWICEKAFEDEIVFENEMKNLRQQKKKYLLALSRMHKKPGLKKENDYIPKWDNLMNIQKKIDSELRKIKNNKNPNFC